MIQVDYNTACSKTKGDDGLVKHLSVKENIKIDLSASVEFLGMVFFVDTLEIKHGFLNFIKGGETIAYKYLKTDITLEPKSDKKFVIKECEARDLTLDELREVWKIESNKRSEEIREFYRIKELKRKRYIPWEYKFKENIIRKIIGKISKGYFTVRRLNRMLPTGYRCRNYSWQ